MSHAPREDNEPWYKQFWPWFLITLPSLAVLGSMITIKLAVDSSDGLVVEDYYKQGLTVNKDLSKERMARAMGLAARMSVNPETRELRLDLTGKRLRQPPGRIEARFAHPTQSGHDFTLQMVLAGENHRYLSRLPEGIPAADWRVIISPPNDEWRIVGRYKLPGDQLPVKIR